MTRSKRPIDEVPSLHILSTMSNCDTIKIPGTIFGVYQYNGYRVFRVKCEDMKDVYVNDDFVPVVILDENNLQTIKVMIDGELKSPWSH